MTEEGEGAADLLLQGEAGGEGTVGPVSEKRRQEEKGKAATRDCNMAAVVFLSQNCSHSDEEVVITPAWGEVGFTQPLDSSPRPGDLRQTRASFRCCSYVHICALLL